MVEIGNEDNLGGGCESYAERFTAFYDAIHKQYPDLTLIASTDNASCLPSNLPEGAWLDYHIYNSADGLVSQFNMFDNKDRSVPYFVGEYSRHEIEFPNMQGSVAEAVFMIGLERNSDLVKMAAYAPLLQLLNATQWTVCFNFNNGFQLDQDLETDVRIQPDLIPFTQDPGNIIETTSYYVQQLFSINRGDTIKEATSDSAFGPVYWVASSAGNRYFVKMANYSPNAEDVTVSVPGTRSGKLTVLADDDPNASNSDSETLVTPSEKDITGENGSFSFSLPAWSVAVLAVN